MKVRYYPREKRICADISERELEVLCQESVITDRRGRDEVKVPNLGRMVQGYYELSEGENNDNCGILSLRCAYEGEWEKLVLSDPTISENQYVYSTSNKLDEIELIVNDKAVGDLKSIGEVNSGPLRNLVKILNVQIVLRKDF